MTYKDIVLYYFQSLKIDERFLENLRSAPGMEHLDAILDRDLSAAQIIALSALFKDANRLFASMKVTLNTLLEHNARRNRNPFGTDTETPTTETQKSQHGEPAVAEADSESE